MRIVGAFVILFGFFIFLSGYVQPHLLPKEAYEVFFGLQSTTLIGLIVGIIGFLAIAKSYMRAR